MTSTAEAMRLAHATLLHIHGCLERDARDEIQASEVQRACAAIMAAGVHAALAQQPSVPSAEPILWQYRWTNPGDNPNTDPAELEWKIVAARNLHMETIESRIKELSGYTYNGRPTYEVRPLYAAPTPLPATAPEAQADATASVAGLATLMKLADAYAADSATAHVETLYGTSNDYTRKCMKQANEARTALHNALAATAPAASASASDQAQAIAAAFSRGHDAGWQSCAGHMKAQAAPVAPEPFQPRVQPWLLACFGEAITSDKAERNHRFLEESLELVQACGCTEDEARQLVAYVYARPMGEPGQEVGGVMMTLAALCLAQGIDMHAAAEIELARVWTMVEKIRAKQAAKPKHSPLPAAPAPTVQPQPFTQAQMRRLYYNSPEIHNDVTSRHAFSRVVMLTERAHGIRAATAKETP